MTDAAPKSTPKSVEFRREREKTWKELERLIDRAEKRGAKGLSPQELTRLPRLYRTTLSALSVARAISLDKSLEEYLGALTARAYFVVYGARGSVWGSISRFFSVTFPGAVRSLGGYMLAGILVFVLGSVTSFAMVSRDMDRYTTFVSEDMAQGRSPQATTEFLRTGLFDGGDSGDDELSVFATMLFTNNSRVGMMAFAVGFLLGIPTIYILFFNGASLGAFAALYHDRGLAVELWSWLLPHGITELLAIMLCGGAGLVMGHAVLFPGHSTRLRHLADRGKEAGVVVIGCVCLFLVAGVIEGVFRQRVHSVPIRYGLALATAALWAGYFAVGGKRRFGPRRTGPREARP